MTGRLCTLSVVVGTGRAVWENRVRLSTRQQVHANRKVCMKPRSLSLAVVWPCHHQHVTPGH